jgi:hypothetical protein
MTTNEQTQFARNEELVRGEVYVCATPMTEYILSMHDAPNSPFSWDDVENLYAPGAGTEDDGESPQEVYEWWAVSPWLFEELRKRGEPVIDTFPHLWGRTTTGQAIALDGVISDIQRAHKYAQGDEE